MTSGKTDLALLPYYATISGFPVEAWNNLTASHDPGVRMTGEVALPVVSQLLIKHGSDPKMLKVIASHPNALKEADVFLKEQYDSLQKKETTSTAAAAKLVSEGDGTTAAVAGPAAGKLFGLDVLADNIQNDKNNSTNFWILQSAVSWKVPETATTLVMTMDTKPVSSTFSDLVSKLKSD